MLQFTALHGGIRDLSLRFHAHLAMFQYMLVKHFAAVCVL